MAKIISFTPTLLCTVALLFILILALSVITVEGKETPYNYSIETRNQSNQVINEDALCNLTIITTNPIPVIGNGQVVMPHIGEGVYAFPINESWIQGNYATQITCNGGGFENSIFDNFVVGLETTDFRDISIIGTLLMISGLFLFLTFRSEDKVLNPLFFFLGNLFIIVSFFASSLLTTHSSISSIMTRIYAAFIVIYGAGIMFWVFLGYFFPFIMKAFVKKGKSTDSDVEADVL